MGTHAEHMRLMVGGAGAMKRRRVELEGDPVYAIGRLTTRTSELQGSLAAPHAGLPSQGGQTGTVAAEQQGQGAHVHVEQGGGAEPQLFYSDRTTRRPAYDEEAEADGSSDEEDFDQRWADEDPDHEDYNEDAPGINKEQIQWEKENIDRAYRRKYEDRDVALGELRAQTAAVDRAIKQEAGKPGAGEMFQVARRTSGWDPQDPTAPRYMRRQWRPGDLHDAWGPDTIRQNEPVWPEMVGLLRRKQSILKDTGVVETRDDYPDYEETGIRPKVDVPRQRELWAELVAITKARQEALDAPRRVPQGVFLARQYLLPQHTGPVTKKARAGADQTGDGAVHAGFERSGAGMSGPPMRAPAQVTSLSIARLTRKVAGEPHAGASARRIIAGTGVIAPAPGFHYMATGELTANGA